MITPIGLAPRTRLYSLERNSRKETWRLWLARSPEGLGTYLELFKNGRIERVTLRDDIPEERDLIKPEEGFT